MAPDQGRCFRLPSRNSQLVTTRAQPNLAEQIVAVGGRRRRNALSGSDQGVKEDALCRSAPRKIGELATKEASERMGELIPGPHQP